jgi:uncharacterized protein
VPDHVDERFEWDIDKSNRCLRERGFDFRYASRLFETDRYYEEHDERDYGEERYLSVGVVTTVCITIVYTLRDDRKRLISARPSTDEEIESYVRYVGLRTR